MSLSSGVTLGSAALLVAAGVGLAVWSAADEEPAPDQAAASTPTDSSESTRLVKSDGAPRSLGSQRPPGSTGSTGSTEDTPRDKPKRKPDRPKPDLVPNVLVEVYNNSGITGLGADKAALLQGSGWNVAATDNWYGSIPENTVYYPEDLRADAAKLAKTLGVDRLQPAVSPMAFDRLTVIFTST
ncbi:MAG: LytR C-terminal domain-containing protein [Nocardioidaceae bacterium]|nr:LytR C-terminal domain-containing protein [Nocardioidaceae bacterium]